MRPSAGAAVHPHAVYLVLSGVLALRQFSDESLADYANVPISIAATVLSANQDWLELQKTSDGYVFHEAHATALREYLWKLYRQLPRVSLPDGYGLPHGFQVAADILARRTSDQQPVGATLSAFELAQHSFEAGVNEIGGERSQHLGSYLSLDTRRSTLPLTIEISWPNGTPRGVSAAANALIAALRLLRAQILWAEQEDLSDDDRSVRIESDSAPKATLTVMKRDWIDSSSDPGTETDREARRLIAVLAHRFLT